ncbi:MAG: HAD-IB family phosphatase [Gaiellaceae bacterium]
MNSTPRAGGREVARTLLLDFDGTVTEEDMLDRIAREFGDPVVFEEVEHGFERGEVTLRYEIERKLGSVCRPVAAVALWQIEHARLRPGLRELAELARRRGWRLEIVSSSFHELIEPLLAHHGLEVAVHANRVEDGRDGWLVHWAFGEDCETCGEACKRVALERFEGSEIVYVGDGYSDRCAARAADRVFATSELAGYLEREGVAHEHFDDFHSVVAALERA